MKPNGSIHGSLGNATLHLNTNDGVLSLDGHEIVLMRVKMIARLFSDIMKDLPLSGIPHTVGRMLGEDYAVDWLLMKTPIIGGAFELPADLRQHTAEYERLEDQIDRGSLDPAVLSAEKRVAGIIREGLRHWLISLPDATLQSAWQGMLDLDIFGGWGRARLTEFRRADSSAHIEVTASFIARPAHIWFQHGLSQQHVCEFLAGYLEGEARVLFANEDIVGSEQRCRLEGGDVCSFAFQPVAALIR